MTLFRPEKGHRSVHIHIGSIYLGVFQRDSLFTKVDGSWLTYTGCF